jgi:hypothetical protein
MSEQQGHDPRPGSRATPEPRREEVDRSQGPGSRERDNWEGYRLEILDSLLDS